MILCKIKDCYHKYYAKGYCEKHWRRIVWYPKHKEYFSQYQKNWHKKHYNYKKLKCKVKNCHYTTSHIYCYSHKFRIIHNLPLNLLIDCRHLRIGKKNNLWRGGLAEYPNHYLMKKNRLLKLQQTQGKCELCGKAGKHIHHKDNSKTNHSLDNLVLLCLKCHFSLHKGRKNKTSKFIKLYGVTIKDLSIKLNLPLDKVYLLHKENLLAKRLLKNKVVKK